MYLYSAALGVVVGLKESRRHGAGLESLGVERMHDPGYVLLRSSLPRIPVNKAFSDAVVFGRCHHVGHGMASLPGTRTKGGTSYVLRR